MNCHICEQCEEFEKYICPVCDNTSPQCKPRYLNYDNCMRWLSTSCVDSDRIEKYMHLENIYQYLRNNFNNHNMEVEMFTLVEIMKNI